MLGRDDDQTPIMLRNEVEASLVDAILREDGIPHVVRSYRDRAYSGIWQYQYGWGRVDAPPEYRSGIRALLAVLRKEVDGFQASSASS
jgi:hypothetical protein